LGLVLCWVLPVGLTQIAIASEKQAIVSKKDILAELSQADVVYLGENHDSVAEHQAQLEIITALYQKNPQIAIALEMFQRPFQPVLDRYLAGEIGETELRNQTEYDKRWGFDWEYYAPILRFAKAHNLPIIALNTPTEITRQVASEGLESLSGDDFRYIPPVAEIKLDNQDYLQMLQNTYSNHAHNRHGNSDGFDNFFAAQVLWDETMADAIAQFKRANPNRQIVVLAGQGHIIYGYGIPQRVQRRIKDNSFVQRSVLLGEFPSFSGENPPADYLWQSE
jgi:uncharacterized iron-regulated protein